MPSPEGQSHGGLCFREEQAGRLTKNPHLLKDEGLRVISFNDQAKGDIPWD